MIHYADDRPVTLAIHGVPPKSARSYAGADLCDLVHRELPSRAIEK
jgi:hypothetical protein